MIVTISSRHMDVSPALKQFAEQKASKLLKFFDRIQEIEVVFDAGKKDIVKVEMIVHAEQRHMLVAHCETEKDAYGNVDVCVDKLERQLSEHKKLIRNRKHSVPDKHE